MGPHRETSAELLGDTHIVNATVTLSLQDVSLHCPEPGASEEGLASREAESVSLGPAVAEGQGEDGGRGDQSPESLAGGVGNVGDSLCDGQAEQGVRAPPSRGAAAERRALGIGRGVCGGGNGRRTARGRGRGVLENRVRFRQRGAGIHLVFI